jgi:hypothetical protein
VVRGAMTVAPGALGSIMFSKSDRASTRRVVETAARALTFFPSRARRLTVI